MLASIPSASLLGATGIPVRVEVHIGKGLPGFRIVGQPDPACRESRDRVRAAVMSTGREWPTRCITVNLAPSGPRKIGAGLDLAIAVGVVVASEQLPPASVAGLGFVGELGLDGSLRRIPGVAPMVAVLGDVVAVVPAASAAEALVAAEREVLVATTLGEVLGALAGEEPWPELGTGLAPVEAEPAPDLADVRGQPVARRALEIAAAGGHHLLMVGSPGSGKTMLARRLPGLLPPLGRDDSLAATMVHSAAGMAMPRGGLVTRPPFRAPHHTTSTIALVGGGSSALRPGEISLSHAGILFLDELGEFSPAALDGLREPLEEGVIRISRAHARAVLPARFQLVAATNPCPCGGGPPGSCECDDMARLRYVRRLSGPLLDRFDLRVAIQRPSVDDLLDPAGGEPSAPVAARVAAARALAMARGGRLNADLHGELLDVHAPLTAPALAALRTEMERGRLTGRGYHRIRRVARTIADLASVELDGVVRAAREVDVEHVEVALSLRTRVRGGTWVGGVMAASTGALAALAGFDLMTAPRLRTLLDHHDAEEAYAVAAGHAAGAAGGGGDVGHGRRGVAGFGARRPPEEWAGVCERLGVVALSAGDAAFPAQLRLDPQPPAVLFVRGDLDALANRRVGVVGTRNATQGGRDTAYGLGRDLAEAGVAVVSGLAKGIDGAAHRGALAVDGGPPVAVVGNGPDRPYPAVNAALWRAVCERGLLLSEWPPGTPPEAFRFPLRNRILAALSEVLVVVESRERGGSLITANAAIERSVDVMAVPGSVRNRAAAGTNHLLRDGAAPVTGADDVLLALGLDTRRAGRSAFDPRPLPRGVESTVLAVCRAEPRTLDDLVVGLGLPIHEAAMALARLERAGWVCESGGWFEAVVSWSGAS